MIESIAITNFFCFKERTELSLIAGKERNRHLDDEYCGFTTLGKLNILKVAFVYGNNGAGKSKMVRAIEIIKHLATYMNDDKTDHLPYHPFEFDEDSKKNPSTIEIVYHFNNVRYKYVVKWERRFIIFEGLSILRLRSEVKCFDRTIVYEKNAVRTNLAFSSSMGLSKEDQDIVKSDLLPNNTILSLVNKKNILNPFLNEQVSYFNNQIQIVQLRELDLDNTLPDSSMSNGRAVKKVILTILRAIDSNIVNYEKLKIKAEIPQSLQDVFTELPEKLRNNILRKLQSQLPKSTIITYHDVGTGKAKPLPLKDQSAGTKEILQLIVYMHEAIRNHQTILLDDFSSGIQRTTLSELLKFFYGGAVDSQMIITTQDYGLLDSPMTRRDSVRFVSKDKKGIAHIKNITLRELHKNLNLPKYISTTNKWGQLPEVNTDILKQAIDEYIETVRNAIHEEKKS